MRARRAAPALLLLVAAGAAMLLLGREDEAASPPPPERPAPELPAPREELPAPQPEPEPVAVPGVAVMQRDDELVARNDDGAWTILTGCRSDGERTAGPGYVSGLVTAAGDVLVDDFAPPQPLNDPGYGGLGTFAWHHARGRPGALRLHARNAWEVSGRICARDNGGFGVSAARLLEPPAAWADEHGEQFVSFAVDVELSDAWTYPRPLMRVRYRYRIHRDSVRSWIAVSERCPDARCGDTSELAFVKEPKLAAGLRSDMPLPYSRVAIFDAEGELRCVYVGGGPPAGPVLDTGQCGHPGRTQARFDAGSADSAAEGGCDAIPCLNVTMRAYPADGGDALPGGRGSPWHGSGTGFDAWAEAAARRPAAFDRDTDSGDGVVWDCHGGSPEGELLRRWETIARVDDEGRHFALAVLFTAWQGGRGGYDCEPLLRTFGRPGETWGAYAEYSVGGES